MTRAMTVMLVVAGACGSPSPSPTTPADPEEEPAQQPITAAPVDAAVAPPPPPPPPVAQIDNVIVDGVHAAEGISALLAPKLPALAACLSGDGVARATEVSLIVVDNTTELRVAWQGGQPVTLPCLTELLGASDTLEVSWDTKFSTAYAVVRTVPHDAQPPPAPTPPDRRADVQLLFCDLFVVSGAGKTPAPAEKQNIALAYGRAHARHPRSIHIALEVSQWSPHDRSDKLVRIIKAEGIKRCALQRF